MIGNHDETSAMVDAYAMRAVASSELCHHQHPAKPAGVIISSHPMSEPCLLREAALRAELAALHVELGETRLILEQQDLTLHRMRAALTHMTLRFGVTTWSTVNGLSTGGDLALEQAFKALGWFNPPALDPDAVPRDIGEGADVRDDRAAWRDDT
jgi:hypothetical protein